MTRDLRTRTLTLAANQLTSGEGQGDWRQSAACTSYPLAREADPWFPTSGQGVDSENEIHDQQIALTFCAGCDVRRECLNAAMDEERGLSAGPRHGIRGGLTPQQRADWDKATDGQWRDAPMPPVLACGEDIGTDAGWQKHRDAHQHACRPCQRARDAVTKRANAARHRAARLARHEQVTA